MQMINDYVALKVEKERATESGLLIADSNKSDRPQIGTVMYGAITCSSCDDPKLTKHQKRDLCRCTEKNGKKVIFGGWYDPIEIDGEELYIVSIEDIKAIL